VRLRDAATGAIIATLLFELLKRGFGLYLHYFPTYQAVYGALATVPVLLLWTYLAWLIVLLGAEIVAALPEWRSGRRVVGGDIHRSDSFVLVMEVLRGLRQSASYGRGIKAAQLQVDLKADPGRLSAMLDSLRRINVATRSDDDRWHLSRDLRDLSLFDLCRQLGLVLSDPSLTPTHLQPLVQYLDGHERAILERSVDDWLTDLQIENSDAEATTVEPGKLPQAGTGSSAKTG
jgi:membrane protein